MEKQQRVSRKNRLGEERIHRGLRTAEQQREEAGLSRRILLQPLGWLFFKS